MNYEWYGVTYKELTLSLPACTSDRCVNESESVGFLRKAI